MRSSTAWSKTRKHGFEVRPEGRSRRALFPRPLLESNLRTLFKRDLINQYLINGRTRKFENWRGDLLRLRSE